MKLKDQIIIKDWAGNILFEGNYKDKQVDQVLEANRCQHCQIDGYEVCEVCEGTGYWGEFEVYWKDENDERNVYECINY